MANGLYDLIGGGKNGDISSKTISDFIDKNPNIDLITKERLLKWQSEFEYWGNLKDVYPYMELGYHYRSLIKTISKLTEPSAGQVWLDAGCGPAKMSELLWEKSGRSLKKIVGIDIVLNCAEERAQRIPVLDLKYGNLGEILDFKNSTFDGIISNIALPYVIEFEGIYGKDGIQMIFREMFRVLKPGGQFIWSTPNTNMQTWLLGVSTVPDVIRNLSKLPSFKISSRLLYHADQLKKKGKNGTYTYLLPKNWDVLLSKAGFSNSTWKHVISHQVWVNKCYKKK